MQSSWDSAGVAGSETIGHSPGVHRSSDHRSVVKVPLGMCSDGLSIFSDLGTLVPVNGTDWGMPNLSQAYQRCLDGVSFRRSLRLVRSGIRNT